MVDFKKLAENKNGPRLWNKLLEPIREFDPCAVIAGGAVRDRIIGIKPRDYDIFVNLDKHALNAIMEAELPRFGLGLLDKSDEHSKYATDTDWHPEVNAVLDGHYYTDDGTIQVQIIARPMDFMTTPEEYGLALINRIDIGICQCFWSDLKSTAVMSDFWKSSDFQFDFQNKRVTIRRQSSKESLIASTNRVERILKRFHDEGLEDWKWGTS